MPTANTGGSWQDAAEELDAGCKSSVDGTKSISTPHAFFIMRMSKVQPWWYLLFPSGLKITDQMMTQGHCSKKRNSDLYS
jgi:hypothetical protein